MTARVHFIKVKSSFDTMKACKLLILPMIFFFLALPVLGQHPEARPGGDYVLADSFWDKIFPGSLTVECERSFCIESTPGYYWQECDGVLKKYFCDLGAECSPQDYPYDAECVDVPDQKCTAQFGTWECSTSRQDMKTRTNIYADCTKETNVNYCTNNYICDRGDCVPDPNVNYDSYVLGDSLEEQIYFTGGGFKDQDGTCIKGFITHVQLYT